MEYSRERGPRRIRLYNLCHPQGDMRQHKGSTTSPAEFTCMRYSDAHNCIPDFDDKTGTSFFAVYDGHGGSEVAKYCELHFPDFVKEFMESTGGLDTEPTKFIQSAFLAFDATLTSEDVIKELKSLSGKEDDYEEDEDEDPVYRSETDLLNEEATMPLDQVLAQYNATPGDVSKDKASSAGGSTSSAVENGPVSSSNIPSASSASLSSFSSASSQPAQSSSTHVNNGDSSHGSPVQKNGIAAEASTNSNCESSAHASNLIAAGSSSGDSGAKPQGKAQSSGKGKKTSDAVAESSTVVSSSSSSKAGSSSKHQDGPSGSSSKSAGNSERSSKVKAAADMAKVASGSDSDDDEDDDEDEEGDMWEDTSDDEDEDDEEDADAEQDDNIPMMDTSDEEPGSDSGCTACVLLKQGRKLLVANAGDSRCVLARAGRALDLSFDHKPEDDPERTRIEKAGGKVTADGRVNGGLNLSRAIGDHVYKRNTEVSAREQMITALPDVQIEELSDQDQFIVIACDGIWNYMSSQEVVDYVLVKLRDPEKKKQPAVICEEMFDHCLAPNTFGDGTGCDNMTCIIIILDTFYDSGVPDKPMAEESSVAHKLCDYEDKVLTTSDEAADTDNSDKEQSESGNGSTVIKTDSNISDSIANASLGEQTSALLKRCADDVDELPEKKRLKVDENLG
ncbi:protein phosphatase 1g [Plakobranchus ocellatus]|uniref:protein-serine/threonine phosphatase n=1 Tax=Plakobranchus ocellatus TaxID=259542 RepID=A0AAV4ACD2_9GAST|nr:protein phosphatase 1g [Plakobranchus ocellatus]